METAIQIFNNPQFGEIRATEINGQPYFTGKDIACILGYVSTDNAIRDHVDDEDKLLLQLSDIQDPSETMPSHMKGSKVMVINESGVYSLILRSKLGTAKAFKKWVTSEVLPSIRKHGAYLTNQKLEDIASNPDLLIELANTIKKEREEKLILQQQNEFQQEQIKKIAPKAEYFDNVLISKSTYVTDQIAKELGMTAIKLNKLLFQKGIQFKRNGQWVLTTRFCNSGYTRTNTYFQPDGLGGTTSRMSTVWTEKGRLLIHKIYDGEIIRTGSCVPT